MDDVAERAEPDDEDIQYARGRIRTYYSGYGRRTCAV
jgi:hypothetical protein